MEMAGTSGQNRMKIAENEMDNTPTVKIRIFFMLFPPSPEGIRVQCSVFGVLEEEKVGARKKKLGRGSVSLSFSGQNTEH